MEQQPIREDALRGLTILAINDRRFRSEAVNDLEGTLRRYGYDLNDQEMEEVRNFHSSVANMNDEEIVRELTEGPAPEPRR